LDTGTGLTSSVVPLAATQSTPDFNVSWSGTDAANSSGITSYDIYVSDDGGPYLAWLSAMTPTTATYAGQAATPTHSSAWRRTTWGTGKRRRQKYRPPRSSKQSLRRCSKTRQIPPRLANRCRSRRLSARSCPALEPPREALPSRRMESRYGQQHGGLGERNGIVLDIVAHSRKRFDHAVYNGDDFFLASTSTLDSHTVSLARHRPSIGPAMATAFHGAIRTTGAAMRWPGPTSEVVINVVGPLNIDHATGIDAVYDITSSNSQSIWTLAVAVCRSWRLRRLPAAFRTAPS